MGVVLFFDIFFSHEEVGPLPIVVVDCDNSPLSRRLVSMIGATPQISIVEDADDMGRARSLVLQGKACGVVEIPRGFARQLLSGESGSVRFYDSGTNLSANSLSAKVISGLSIISAGAS